MSEYTLYLGDCLEYMKTMEPGSVDAIITDLPYGTTQCSWDEIIPFAPMWEGIERLCKGAFVTTAAQPFTSKLVMSKIDWFRYDITWKKGRVTGHLDAKRKPLREHENILVFSKNGHTYNPQMSKGVHIRGPFGKNKNGPSKVYNEFSDMDQYRSDEYYPRSIIEFMSDMQPIHPTQKPVSLYQYLVLTYTNAGDKVLDFCMGSGTTGVACMQLGRRFVGCEIDPGYYAIAEKRIKQAAAQMLLPLETAK